MVKYLSKFNILREARELNRFFNVDNSEREVVFYAEDKGSYSYFEGLIDCLTNVYNQKVHYFTSDKNDPLFNTAINNLSIYYIYSLLSTLIKYCDSKVLVMTMPDLEMFHVKRSKFPLNHVYIFHNIGSAFSTLRFGALFHYDTIFCVGPHHVEEIKKQREVYNLRGQGIVEFGYYRLETIHEEYKTFLSSGQRNCNYKARLLVAPSWGEEAILNLCGREVIKNLLENDYEVVVRPHPMSVRHEGKLLDSLNNTFQNYDNYHYQDDISYYEDIYQSDVLITDWSGIMYEYALGTERPVLFVDVPQKIKNPRFMEIGVEIIEPKLRHLIGIVIPMTRLSDINQAVSELLLNPEKYREKIVEARNKYVFNFGNSSKIGAEYIVNYCKRT